MAGKSKIVFVDLVDEEAAARVAWIIGPFSAHGRALAELAQRRAAGEDLALVRADDKTLFIVPRAALNPSIVPSAALSRIGGK